MKPPKISLSSVERFEGCVIARVFVKTSWQTGSASTRPTSRRSRMAGGVRWATVMRFLRALDASLIDLATAIEEHDDGRTP